MHASFSADGSPGRPGHWAAGAALGLPWLPQAGIRVTAGPVVLRSLLLLIAPKTLAQEDIRLACEPRTFQVVPGQPVRLELNVKARTAVPIRLHVPPIRTGVTRS